MGNCRQADCLHRFRLDADRSGCSRRDSMTDIFLLKVMAIEFTFANGKHEEIDYTLFEKEVKAMLPCSQASVYLLNEFPAVVSPDSSIDLLLILAIEDKLGNFFRLLKKDRHVYVNNLIIPVRFLKNFAGTKMVRDEDGIFAGEEPLDFMDDISGLRQGLADYLSVKCNFNRSDLFVHPLIFIQHPDFQAFEDHIIVHKHFHFSVLIDYLKICSHDILCSYRLWKNREHYLLLDKDIQRIIAQAARDSVTGYLTRQKLERITQAVSAEFPLYDDVGQYLVSIEGKAGTGKTSQLLSLMMKCIDGARNTLYLTYNKLLVFDIARFTQTYLNKKRHGQCTFSGLHSVVTLHGFFYRLSRRLGVLHVMSEIRINALEQLLQTRVNTIYKFLKRQPELINNASPDGKTADGLKERIQNSPSFEVGTKEVGVELVRYLFRHQYLTLGMLKVGALAFTKHKKELLAGTEASRMFLADYYEVLENTLLAIQNPEAYFERFDIEKKYKLLAAEMNLKPRHLITNDDLVELIRESEFLKTLRRKVNGVRKGRIVFVDEAQDCHPYEKDILFAVFGLQNLIIANGGREQLIRHNELCRWELFQKRRLRLRSVPAKRKQLANPDNIGLNSLFGEEEISRMTVEISDEEEGPFDMIRLRNPPRSFRIKKSLLDFCNFVADSCGVELAMSALNSKDQGELILDFRFEATTADLANEFQGMLKKAGHHGCSAYESMLVLIDADAKVQGAGKESLKSAEAIINEYGNIEETRLHKKADWAHKRELETDLMFWDGATDDKNQLGIPSPNECRLLFYESCRGLEAWSVACFNIDRFYNSRLNDPEAELFLLSSEKESGMQQMNITNDERKAMFAGTWVLMALTRPIDTLYLKFDHPDAAFTQMARRYLLTQPKGVRVLE